MTTESTSAASPWVVLKFGGTSVSSVTNWKNIAAVLRDRLAEGLRPVVIHSALSGITDRLEQLLSLVRQSGVAALIATHNLDLAARMDRTLRLKEGHLVEEQITVVTVTEA